MGTLYLAAFGGLEALFCAAVRFDFRHNLFLRFVNLLCCLGGHKHQDLSALQFGLLVNRAQLADPLGKALHGGNAQVRVGHLPPAQADRYLQLVAGL
mgnify:CR=1 FL=1